MSKERTGRAAFLVATGIFASRIAGLVRQSVFAHYFGTSASGDAFQAAFRIPNMLQNLFGEGVLSASFIPEYSTLLAKGDKANARAVAGVVVSALAIAISLVVLLGVYFAPFLVDLLASGFAPEQRDLATTLVRILFPGAALLVLSAWCLGILNSHRLFLLSYMAPLAWNAAMIGALLIYGGGRSQGSLAVILAWASVVGSIAQFLVQLPSVVKVAGVIKPHLSFALEESKRVFRNFFPAFLTRGVAQISGLIDLTLASHLPLGSVSAIAYSQTLYMLPGSLFGMSVSAAELPAMSSIIGNDETVFARLRDRFKTGLERISYFVVPCLIAYVVLGDLIIATIFQSGRFEREQTVWVWQILIGASVGLLAGTLSRLTTSTYFVLRDTKTPLRFAVLRLVIGTGVGIALAFGAPRWLGIDARYGAIGLTLASSIAALIEFRLLRGGLEKRIGRVRMERSYLVKLWLASTVAGALGWLATYLVNSGTPIISAAVGFSIFGAVYLGVTYLFRVSISREITGRVLQRITGKPAG